MKVCPRCSESNGPDAPTCRRCHASLNAAPRVCPAGRHMMDPTWTECAYCRSDNARGHGGNPAAGNGRRPTFNEPNPNGFGPPASNVPGFPGFAMPQAQAGAPSPQGPQAPALPPTWAPSAASPQFGPGMVPALPGDPPPARRSQTMSESEFRRALGIVDGRVEPRPDSAADPRSDPRQNPKAEPNPRLPKAQPAPPPILEPEAVHESFSQPYDRASLPPLSGRAAPAPDQSGLPPGGRRTIFVGHHDDAGSARGAGEERRIVGLLISYTWKPAGQVFTVREGRNLIGRDPERCDICIPEDQTLSAVNTHITYRRNFIIGDSVSMGGTDVNDVPIEEQFVPLPNYARVRTGSTYWTFIMASPAPVADEPILAVVPAEPKPAMASRKGPNDYE